MSTLGTVIPVKRDNPIVPSSYELGWPVQPQPQAEALGQHKELE